ncbi:hypothetical protein DFJ73DRAFT_630228 [Zopfochytrium polystomum]|nr:hypothetical protein DFJ73DRAFT_630228 [Zopfochytrium polystomum]
MKLALFFSQQPFRFPNPIKKAILKLLVDIGVNDVPTLHMIKKIQKHAVNLCQITTRSLKTSTGKVVHYNSIADTIRLELARPQIWEHLNFYPTLSECVSELSECNK